MNELINNFAGQGYTQQWLYAAIIGFTITLVIIGIVLAISSRNNPLRRRLESLTSNREEDAKRASLGSTIGSSLRPLGSVLMPRKEEEKETLRKKLVHAGYRSDTAAATMYGVKILFIVVFPACTILYLSTRTDVAPGMIWVAGIIAALVGMLAPSIYLERKVENRQYELMRGFPDALDLLVTCTEAGLGLNAALQRVARQLYISSPILANELEVVNAEIRGGVDRMVALRHLVDRTGLDDIRGLVSLLTQSMRFGTSIADVLRVYSEEFRDKRMQRLEEQAAMIGTKLIFPLCLCIFPSFFVVVVGPAVIAIIRSFSKGGFV